MEKKHAYSCLQEVLRESIHLYSVCFSLKNTNHVFEKEYIDMYYKCNDKIFVVVREYLTYKKGLKKFKIKFNSYESKDKAFTYIRNVKRRIKEDTRLFPGEFFIEYEETKG